MKGSYGRYALVGALLCAMLAAWFNVRFLKAREMTTQVVTVAKEIQPYTAIPQDAIRLTAVPKDAVPADAITDPAALKEQYSRALLIPGSVIRQAHLVPAAGSNLSARLAVEKAHNMRAMALQVTAATGVAGTLKEGDPVDILAAVKQEQKDAKGQQVSGTLARVIAQRVPVLYVDRTDGSMGSAGQMTVVLQVTPEKAEEIAFAQSSGMIWLLTSPYRAQAEPVATTGVTPELFFQRYGVKMEELNPGSEPRTGAAQSNATKAQASAVNTPSTVGGGNR